MDTLFCIGCQASKPATSFKPDPNMKIAGRLHVWDCDECVANGKDRTNREWERLLKKYGAICQSCHTPRPIMAEEICGECWALRGFRFCSRCKAKKLPYLDFYPKRSECIDCSADKALVTRFKKCTKCQKWRGKQAVKCVCEKPRFKKCQRCKKMLDGAIFSHAIRVCDICFERNVDEFSKLESDFIKEKQMTHKERLRNTQLKKLYGISLDGFNAMLAAQKGLCAICNEPPIETKTLCVDHNHATNKVRRLLCHNCNWGIGLFKDNPKLLRVAADYVEDYS